MFRTHQPRHSDGTATAAGRRVSRSRWAALGAAVAVSIGAGSIGLVEATVDSGDRPVLVQIDPCRLVDTRAVSTVGPRNTPIGTAETYTVAAHGMNGNCDLPPEAVGLSLNVTAVQATAQTNVRIFPDANAVPLASNLNPSPASPPVPNAVTTELDGAGAFSIFNEFGSVGIVIDVNGYYEDHNHDDRYVLQADFDIHDHDDRYVEQTDVLWAVVDGDGTVERSSDGVTSAELINAVPPVGTPSCSTATSLTARTRRPPVGLWRALAPRSGLLRSPTGWTIRRTGSSSSLGTRTAPAWRTGDSTSW